MNLSPRNFKNVSFRQLQVFECVANLGNFTAASRELHITQPTVSMQMKRLEESLNTRLFEQVGRQVHLTYEGHAFLTTCREIFTAVTRFDTRIENRIETVSGTLRISGVTTTEYFVSVLVGAFKQFYPQVNFSLSILERENLFRRLKDNSDDLYLLDQVPKNIEVEAIPFIKNPLVIVASAHHPLAKRKHLTMDALLNETFLLREPTSGTRIALKKFLESKAITLNIGMELSSNEALKQAVASNMGLSVLSQYCVARECARGELVMLNVHGFPLVDRWYIVHPKDRHLSPAAAAFLRFLLDDGAGVIEQIVRV
ncbi:MAG: LysR family transcriptional regulator [Gammaproteobacteria bacterium]|nr:MAG: LysR family transcriptional regulator [Gammaproteobacteria bacterium]TND04473.1 MAG: LysR family transcriptional regulator [Gammaproteobacteria bacterium]